jgi:uncharacterized protein YbjT (DUF2867 family)
MILVTGATGHTGQRLIERLLACGESIRVLTRRAPEHLPARLHGAEIVRGDIEDPACLARAASGCRAIIAMTHIRFAARIVAAARDASVRRVLFMSSARRFTKYPEQTARWVIEGEQAVMESGLDWTILRPTMIYGGDEDNNLTHLIRSLRRWPVHALPDGGRMLWQPVFTWDVVAAILAALENPQTIQRDYTLAGPEPVSYAEMVRTILRAAGLRRLLVPVPLGVVMLAARLLACVMSRPPLRPDQVQRMREDKVFDITAARRDLGFDPIPFAEGIRRKLAGEV